MTFTVVIYGTEYRGDTPLKEGVEEFGIYAFCSHISYIAIIDCYISLAVRLSDASFCRKSFSSSAIDVLLLHVHRSPLDCTDSIAVSAAESDCIASF